MSVCVCLVGFASLQSTWAHTLRHPCLACSSRCTEYCHSHNNCKKTIIPQKSPSHLPPLSKVRCCRPKKFGRLPEGLLASPSLRTTFLPPLVKGEVLSPKKFGRLPEGLSHLPYPFRFSDTSVNNLSFRTKPSQNRTIARKALSHLPPLSKGGGIDGKAQTVALLRFNCISTPFLSPNLFAVKTEGLLHPLAPHQPFQTRTIPPAFRVVSSTAPLPTK